MAVTVTYLDLVERLRRPARLAAACDYTGLDKLKGVEERMRRWAQEAARLAPNAASRNLLSQLAALFPDERADLLPERLQRADRLLAELDARVQPQAPRRRPRGVNLDTNVQWLKGVGAKRAEAFARLGVTTAYDLLRLFPRRYLDRREFTPLGRAQVGEAVTVEGIVADVGLSRRRFGRTLVVALVGDDTGDIVLKWFNAPYVAGKIKAGDRLVASGVVKRYETLEIINPEFEVLGPQDGPGAVRGIVPLYPLSAGLTQKAVRTAVRQALEVYAPAAAEVLPPEVLARTGFPSVGDAFRQIHFPDDMEKQAVAKRRLVFEHLFLMEVGLAIRKRLAAAEKGVVIRGDGRLRDKVRLPFGLTAGQKKALEDILKDLAAPWPMKRLLQGDVGCGKTVVAIFAMLAAAEDGFQAALMAPTEVLARQHWATAYRWLRPAGVECALLTAATGPDERRRVLSRLASGSLQLVIGTHALLEETVVFSRLGLAVVDEQHRFGVAQRHRLSGKGPSPNLLVMTATPIPRTLALCLYGDLELTLIEDMPAGRPPRRTLWLPSSRRAEAFNLLSREVAAGRQGYVVYPLVEESDHLDLKAATVMVRELAAGVLAGREVRLVHGQMRPEEREAAMSDFRAGRVDVLVATTVVEVGLDVPNATVMIVEHAERYGLSQLHQLRGRVGRGPFESYFVMVTSDNVTPEGESRLRTLTTTEDGFAIAEADLRQRGPGELLGTRQHGLPDFALQALVEDRTLYELARRYAAETLAADPPLERDEHRALRNRLRSDLAQRWALADAI